MVAGMDALTPLRRRILELVDWLAVDDRFQVAQKQWHRLIGKDVVPSWDSLVSKEFLRLENAIETVPGPRFPPLDPMHPERALIELEAIDELAWVLRGPQHGAPYQAFERDGVVRYVVPRWRERTPPTAEQPGRLSAHVRHHSMIPDRVTIPDRPRPIRVDVKPLVGVDKPPRPGSVSVIATAFHDGAAIEWKPDASGGPTAKRATSIDRDAEREATLLAQLKRAAEADIAVLVAPELTVTPRARRAIQKTLRGAPGKNAPSLFVPGSFHELAKNGQFVNRSFLLDHLGNEKHCHDKLVAFGSFEDFVESIDAQSSLTALIAPFGIVLLVICKDFCDLAAANLFQRVDPDWILVPAFGRGANAHVAAATNIARTNGTVTVIAHQAGGGEPAFRSLIHDGQRISACCDEKENHVACCSLSILL